MNRQGKRVAIIHPDLGIGGAEQLIINVALALESQNYQVHMYTPFFDPERCLNEAKQLEVRVHGSWFPRAIFGRLIAFCAYIRMMLCCIWLLILGPTYDYYVLDQVSFPIPLLRCRRRNVLFYCHYPDKLLSTDRRSLIKRVYRFFLDNLEEITTGMARCIVVNSQFTQKVFYDNFPLIRKYCHGHRPRVLYPSIDVKSFKKNPSYNETINQLLGREVTEKTVIMTSLNRYEKKKNIDLALESFAYYIKNNSSRLSDIDPVLVIAGGYDTRLTENVDVHRGLMNKAKDLGVSDRVVFLCSISGEQRVLLLENTKILMYTPENEHFGIVPVEAMYMGCIVFACNSGGPLESVEDTKTGYLMSPNVEEWGKKIGVVLNGSKQAFEDMRMNARKRVERLFTFKVFAAQLDEILQTM